MSRPCRACRPLAGQGHSRCADDKCGCWCRAPSPQYAGDVDAERARAEPFLLAALEAAAVCRDLARLIDAARKAPTTAERAELLGLVAERLQALPPAVGQLSANLA